MPVPPELLARARKLRTSAAADLLASHYPAVCRMARGLCGDEAAARRVVRFVLSRSLNALPKWHDESAPDRWFYHHALLSSRRESARPPAPADDLLFVADGAGGAAYLAFVRALRNLPPQQREAFILHHGERLNPRYLGVAMDCSVLAADAHLAAAERGLKPVAGDAWPSLADRLSRAYAALAPPAADARAAVGGYVTRHVWPRRVFKWLRLLIALAVLGALAGFVWQYRQNLESYFPK